MTTHTAVLKAITGKWMIGYEVQREVYQLTGKPISESSATRRIRELREPKYGGHNVQCRVWSRQEGKRVHEYTV